MPPTRAASWMRPALGTTAAARALFVAALLLAAAPAAAQPAPAPPPDELVGRIFSRFPMDGSFEDVGLDANGVPGLEFPSAADAACEGALELAPGASYNMKNPPVGVPLGNDPWTLGFYVKPVSFGLRVLVHMGADDAEGSGVAFILTDSGNIRIWDYMNNPYVHSSITVPLHAWTHVALLYNGRAFQLFLNNEFTFAYAVSFTLLASSAKSTISFGDKTADTGANKPNKGTYYLDEVVFATGSVSIDDLLAPCTLEPPTPEPPTPAPPTQSPPTPMPASPVPPTPAPPTVAPPTSSPSTLVPPTQAPRTMVPTTMVPTTVVPATPLPATAVPATPVPATAVPRTLAPPKATDGLSEEKREGLNTVEGAAAVTSILAGGAGGAVGKLAMLKSFACEMDDVDLNVTALDFEFHPSSISFGDKPHRYLLAAAIMNPVIVTAVVALLYLISTLFHYSYGYKWERALGNARAFGLAYIPYLFLLQGTSLVGTRLAFYSDDTGETLIGVITLVVCYGSPLFLYKQIIRRVDAKCICIPDPVLYPDDPLVKKMMLTAMQSDMKVYRGWVRKMYCFAYGESIWVNQGEDSYFAEKQGVIFESMRNGKQWFGLTEIAVILLLSGFSAWKPETKPECNTRNSLIVILMFWFVCMVVAHRPYAAPMDNLFSFFLALMMFTACLFMTISIWVEADPEGWLFGASFWLLLLSAVFLMVKCVWDFGSYGMDIWIGRRFGARELARRGGGLGSDSKEASLLSKNGRIAGLELQGFRPKDDDDSGAVELQCVDGSDTMHIALVTQSGQIVVPCEERRNSSNSPHTLAHLNGCYSPAAMQSCATNGSEYKPPPVIATPPSPKTGLLRAPDRADRMSDTTLSRGNTVSSMCASFTDSAATPNAAAADSASGGAAGRGGGSSTAMSLVKARRKTLVDAVHHPGNSGGAGRGGIPATRSRQQLLSPAAKPALDPADLSCGGDAAAEFVIRRRDTHTVSPMPPPGLGDSSASPTLKGAARRRRGSCASNLSINGVGNGTVNLNGSAPTDNSPTSPVTDSHAGDDAGGREPVVHLRPVGKGGHQDDADYSHDDVSPRRFVQGRSPFDRRQSVAVSPASAPSAANGDVHPANLTQNNGGSTNRFSSLYQNRQPGSFSIARQASICQPADGPSPSRAAAKRRTRRGSSMAAATWKQQQQAQGQDQPSSTGTVVNTSLTSGDGALNAESRFYQGGPQRSDSIIAVPRLRRVSQAASASPLPPHSRRSSTRPGDPPANGDAAAPQCVRRRLGRMSSAQEWSTRQLWARKDSQANIKPGGGGAGAQVSNATSPTHTPHFPSGLASPEPGLVKAGSRTIAGRARTFSMSLAPRQQGGACSPASRSSSPASRSSSPDYKKRPSQMNILPSSTIQQTTSFVIDIDRSLAEAGPSNSSSDATDGGAESGAGASFPNLDFSGLGIDHELEVTVGHESGAGD